MNDVVNKLLEEARDWKELTLAERQGSEAAFQFGRREVGHLHRGTLHVSFPRDVRDELIEKGEAQVHPFNPDTGWVEVPLESETDLETGRSILLRSYTIVLEANEKKRNDD